jgi:hypothetical protein
MPYHNLEKPQCELSKPWKSQISYTFTLKMETAIFAETFYNFQHSTWLIFEIQKPFNSIWLMHYTININKWNLEGLLSGVHYNSKVIL